MPKLMITQVELDYSRLLEQQIAAQKAQVKLLEEELTRTHATFYAMLQDGAKIQRGPLTVSIELEEKRKSVSWKTEFILVRSEVEAQAILDAQPISVKEVIVVSPVAA
jgi:hypothetical protein